MLKIKFIIIENSKRDIVTDNGNPVFTVAAESDGQDVRVESVKIEVSCAAEAFWKYKGKDTVGIVYAGKPLKPFTQYAVKAAITDNYKNEAEAEVFFRTGRMDVPWTGGWITDGEYSFDDKVSPAPMCFKKDFNVKGKIKRAFIMSTALGIYNLQLNGEKIGDEYFAPGFTSYEHTIQYQTYDITDMLNTGENKLSATVGGGWAVGRYNHVSKTRISADKQALLAEIAIEYENGKTEIIATDESWFVCEGGNVLFADWYDGEVYDARVELSKAAWKKASRTEPRYSAQIVAQYGDSVKAHEIFKPISVEKAPSGEIIYDFGQNFAGVIKAEINGKDGQKIVFRHAEVLYKGELFVKSLRTAKATAEYICRDGAQEYSPSLTYMGFRYVGVSGIDEKDLKLSAAALYTDIEQNGGFECSDALINRLQKNIEWGGKSNFVDIPTDCPQRDEREGWTGDIAVFANTANFNFDMARFLEKWIKDAVAEQGKGGGIPMVVPKQGTAMPPVATSCWGDSIITVPWSLYQTTGDINLIKRSYPAMKKYIKAVKWWAGFLSVGKYSRRVWRFLFHFGDWCAPGGNVMNWIFKGKWVGTAYWSYTCLLMSKMAALLDKPEDEKYYLKLRGEICEAYRRKYTNKKGKLKKEFQTGYVLPLYFDMADGDEKKTMAENLVKLVKAADYHLGTGFTGTPYLLFALSDNGYADAAYKILLQDTCPSWLYEVKSGGTTIWERWDALRPDGSVNIGDLTGGDNENSGGGMVSFNHYAMGAVGDWLYRRAAGVEAAEAGYKKITIKPVVGGGLTFVKAYKDTNYGRVSSEWKIDGGTFEITAEIPVNTDAEIVLPDGTKHCVGSGLYNFKCAYKEK